MAVIKKKTPKSSTNDLVIALDKLIILLEGQSEDEAAADLTRIQKQLQQVQPATQAFKQELEKIIDAFQGEHELESYTIRRESSGDQWTEAEELYIASTTVWNLANRLMRTMD